MSDELAGFGVPSWLPASVQRSMALEEIAEAKAARDAEREREASREAAHDRALLAYRSQAEARGEHIGALSLATGEGVGRSLQDVLADAQAQADMADAREAGRLAREARNGGPLPHVEFGEARIGRSGDGWPASGYEADRLIRMAGDNRRWLAAYETRLASRQGRYGERVAAVRSAAGAGAGVVSRDRNCYDAGQGLMVRGCSNAVVSVR